MLETRNPRKKSQPENTETVDPGREGPAGEQKENAQQENGQGLVQRVVVALDASECSKAVLRTAARISAALNAQLEGFFVEDAQLLALAELPIIGEVQFFGRVRPFDRKALERDLQALAQEVKRWSTEIARAYNPDWRFHILRGDVAQSLLQAAGERDLLSLGRFGTPICPQPRRLGSVARRVFDLRRAPLLLLHREIRQGQPVIVTTSGAKEELGLLVMAAQLAQVYESEIIVLLEKPDREPLVRDLLADYPVRVLVRRLEPGPLRPQIVAVSQGRGGAVLSHRREPELAELECAVILL